jgi:hypothetical protein
MFFAVLVINFISAYVILDLSFFPIAQVSHLYNRVGNAKVIYVFSVVCFWIWEGFEITLIILVIWWNFDSLTVMYFSILIWNRATWIIWSVGFFYNIVMHYNLTSHWISSLKSHCFRFACWNFWFRYFYYFLNSTTVITYREVEV